MPVHVQHGMEGDSVRDYSDGYTEAWYMPDAKNIPDGTAKVRFVGACRLDTRCLYSNRAKAHCIMVDREFSSYVR